MLNHNKNKKSWINKFWIRFSRTKKTTFQKLKIKKWVLYKNRLKLEICKNKFNKNSKSMKKNKRKKI